MQDLVKSSPGLSLVIPVYNEEESLDQLHKEISEVAERERLDLEILFIDDGSTDQSWAVIRSIADVYAEVQGIRFRRNFGKAAALAAGFRKARGDLVMTLDADLQDDPSEIPNFLQVIANGKDVVSGWKKVRHDPWHKVGPSRIFNKMVSWLTGVQLHDHNCGMKCYRAEALREVKLYGELHRFIPVLAAARGFKVDEVVIQHRARQFGSSKYGVRRFIRGFLDLLTVKFLTGFGRRPQHFLGSIGLFFFSLGGLGVAYLTLIWLLRFFSTELHEHLDPLHQRPLLLYSIGALLLGAQSMSVGLLAEMITAYVSKEEDSYSIAETIETKSKRIPDNSPEESIKSIPREPNYHVRDD
ncbi:MAG: glycosyltransferase family 2 protein [Gemmataceae bacterium]